RAHRRHRHSHVLEDRVVVEEVEHLERPADPETRPAMRRQAGDVLPLETDLAGIGREESGQEGEARRLPPPLRAGGGRQPAGLESEIHAVQDDVPAERLPQAARLEDGRRVRLAERAARHDSRSPGAVADTGAAASPARAACATLASWNPAGWR